MYDFKMGFTSSTDSKAGLYITSPTTFTKYTDIISKCEEALAFGHQRVYDVTDNII